MIICFLFAPVANAIGQCVTPFMQEQRHRRASQPPHGRHLRSTGNYIGTSWLFSPLSLSCLPSLPKCPTMSTRSHSRQEYRTFKYSLRHEKKDNQLATSHRFTVPEGRSITGEGSDAVYHEIYRCQGNPRQEGTQLSLNKPRRFSDRVPVVIMTRNKHEACSSVAHGMKHLLCRIRITVGTAHSSLQAS